MALYVITTHDVEVWRLVHRRTISSAAACRPWEMKLVSVPASKSVIALELSCVSATSLKKDCSSPSTAFPDSDRNLHLPPPERQNMLYTCNIPIVTVSFSTNPGPIGTYQRYDSLENSHAFAATSCTHRQGATRQAGPPPIYDRILVEQRQCSGGHVFLCRRYGRWPGSWGAPLRRVLFQPHWEDRKISQQSVQRDKQEVQRGREEAPAEHP